MNKKFWRNKKVFLTGHTGFKGAWLSLWLNSLGANVVGYALKPHTQPSLFKLCKIDELVDSNLADIRNPKKIAKILLAAKPEIVIHMAAQPLVRESYKLPVETFSTNVMGTVNVLEAVRKCPTVKSVVNVTTDKVYEDEKLRRAYKETQPLGGYDPYASSKACSELVSSAYQRSYGLPIATARAGNVIGGGDWASDRLIPDFIRSILKGQSLLIRSPKATRPWQHVLEPLAGYLILAERLYKNRTKYVGAWNFGPDKKDAKTVEWIVQKLCAKWGRVAYKLDKGKHPHETNCLKLDHTKAAKQLGWEPKWNINQALDKIIDWTKSYQQGDDLRSVCLEQIKEYMEL